MSDYEELIKNLRSVKDTWQTQEEEWMLQAADAIEKLMALPAVPQEMSAREYLTQKARWCHFLGLSSPADASGLTVEKAIEMVAQWAREHPEERSEE